MSPRVVGRVGRNWPCAIQLWLSELGEIRGGGKRTKGEKRRMRRRESRWEGERERGKRRGWEEEGYRELEGEGGVRE